MSIEIDNIILGFRASVMGEILSHRNTNGAGTVAAFKVDVNRHLQRSLDKLRHLPGDVAETTTATLNDTADSVIARIEAAGVVEFADGVI